MSQNLSGDNGVKTTQTAFAIVERLQELDGSGISELASEMGLAKSTIHRHLNTLQELGYVVREGDTFYVGLGFLNLGEYARTRKQEYVMAEPKVKEIARETEERAQFIVEEHGHGVYVYRARGSHAVRTDPGIGKHIPLHAVAAGKAILANLREQEVQRILNQRGLSQINEHTITNREALFEELKAIRKRGYSFNNQENIEGLRAVGVPVRGGDESVLGALSVSGPIHRMKGEWFESELPDLLLGTANELELNIKYG